MEKSKQRFRRITARTPSFKTLGIVDLPPGIPSPQYDIRCGKTISLGRGPDLTLIPPRGIFNDMKTGLRELMHDPQPWLIVPSDRPGRMLAQTLTLFPTNKSGVLRGELRRSSGRVVAEGKIVRKGADAVRFSFKLLCVGCCAVAPEIRGWVNASGRWYFETNR